jgi:hypothetical protein
LYSIIIENNERAEHRWDNINLAIKAKDLTKYQTIQGHIVASGDYRKTLNENCFLRVTMEAMNQYPYNRDFDINWKNINQGKIDITPRK